MYCTETMFMYCTATIYLCTILKICLCTVLQAAGNPTVNLLILDIEGAELAVLKTVPWDKVDIQVGETWDKVDIQVGEPWDKVDIQVGLSV